MRQAITLLVDIQTATAMMEYCLRAKTGRRSFGTLMRRAKLQNKSAQRKRTRCKGPHDESSLGGAV